MSWVALAQYSDRLQSVCLGFSSYQQAISPFSMSTPVLGPICSLSCGTKALCLRVEQAGCEAYHLLPSKAGWLISSWVRDFLLHQYVHTSSRAHLTSVWEPDTLCSGVKQMGCEADHSPLSSAKVKKCVELYLHSPICLPGMRHE